MKRILLTTTSLVLAAGVAQAEVTFSGKAEAGVSRTAKVDAVAQVAGVMTQSGTSDDIIDGTTDYDAAVHVTVAIDAATGNVKTTAATGTATAATALAISYAKAYVAEEQADVNAAQAAFDAANGVATADTAATALAIAKRDLAIAQAVLAGTVKTASSAAVAAGDTVAYSGYDMDVAVSSTLDNGMVLSAAFDMGAGNIADRDDDRVLDAQAAAVALSTVTIKNGGVTYVVGQNKIDDLYDDTQNGDVSVSGAMGGISYTLVADLDTDVKGAAGKYTATNATAAAPGTAVTTRTAAAAGIYNANGSLDTGTTIAAGDSDYVAATWTDAVAAVYESTSLKLSGAAGGVDWTFTTTNKNDRGNAASKVSLGYAAGDALSFTLTHDTQGKREAINTLKASYTMDAITLTASMADDKAHAGNTNTGGKASQNLTIAYANGPLTASFNNDESSKWWATTAYDLGNGADLFATVDHAEFAVVGLTFAF